MRRIVDFSDYQAGLDLDLVAQAVDGAWAKAADWAWVSGHGWPGDDVHDTAVRRFLQLRKPIGSYLFVRPGWTSPATQVDQWRAHTPDGTTIAPMVDLEVPGTLNGASLTDWVDEALTLTADRFEVERPVLYWSASFQSAHGMGVPATPHLPMVAEYHRGYSPFLWADLAGWEQRAYSAYGGPGVPDGYPGLTPLDLIWQFTSSAQMPGFRGLVDCSFCNEAVWVDLLGGSTLGTTGEGDIDLAAKEEILAALTAVQADLQQRVFALHDGSNRRFDALSEVAWATRGDVDQMRPLVALTEQLAEQIRATVGELKAMGGGGVAPDPQAFAAAVVEALAVKLGRSNVAAEPAGPPQPKYDTGDWEKRAKERRPSLPPVAPDARAAAALAAMTSAVFDDHGLVEQTRLRLAKLRGEPPTAEEHLGALTGALGDIADRAALKATIAAEDEGR